MRAEQGRTRHDARAHRADGRRGAAQPRADPAPGRHGVGLVRARRDRASRCSPSSSGRRGDPSRASPTRSSQPSRCSSSPAPARSGLATPMSIMVGVGRGAQAGVLIKNAEALERFEKVDTLVVDKTGTLTEGKPRVDGGPAGAGLRRRRRSLRLAASLEQAQRASARRRRSSPRRDRKLALRPSARDFDSPSGKGVLGHASTGKRVALGNRALPDRAGDRRRRRSERRADRFRARWRDGDLRGGRRQGGGPDRHRRPDQSLERAAALAALKADGMRIVMLTGDNRTTAQAVARTPRHRPRSRRRCCPTTRAQSSSELRARRPRRRHGGRRRQRCAGARRGRRRHRHGHRHGRRDRERRRHAAARATCSGIVRARRLSAGDHAQHPPEPVLRLRLQRGRACRSQRACSIRLSASCCRRSSPPRPWRCRPSASSATPRGCAQ